MIALDHDRVRADEVVSVLSGWSFELRCPVTDLLADHLRRAQNALDAWGVATKSISSS
jgi:hypothetical protein